MMNTNLFKRFLPIGLMSLTGLATVGLTLTPPSAEAAPAFARQMDMQCASCHAQTFPALNSFGRAFKASGYTMMGAKPKIEGENISLPSTFNASVIGKLRYAESNGNTNEGADAGQIEWPNEAALLLGGRVSENVGFVIEAGFGGPVNDEGDSNSLLGSKLQFNVAKVGNTQFSVVPFSTDALGVGYGVELLNTGATRAQRPIEDRTAMSASQALGLGSGEATGISFAAISDQYFVNYTAWTPGWGGENMDMGTDLASYLRAAYMPRIGSWDTGIGFQYMTGTVKQAEGTVNGVDQYTELNSDGWVIDAQAIGQVGGKPLTVLLSTGVAKSDPDSINNTNADDATATAMLLQYGFMPNANAYVAHRIMDNGASENSQEDKTTIGLMYLPAQNIRFELSHAMESGSAVDARANDRTSTTMLQLFTAF